MRDFYDILLQIYSDSLEKDVLSKALVATSFQRGTSDILHEADRILDEIERDQSLKKMWKMY